VSGAARATAALAPRVALVRSRYDPAGGAERFVRNAMAALREQGASITIVTREWPRHEGGAVIVDPFHVGRLWRDWSFARAACRAMATRHFDLVQSHERIACCDIYRAGDGVHAQWLAERARVQGPIAAWVTRMSPHHRYVLAAEAALFASARLKAVICNSDMVRREIFDRFRTPPERLVLIRNAVDASVFHPGLRAESRDAVRQQLNLPRDAFIAVHVGSGFERKGVATLIDAVAKTRGRACAIVVGRDKHAPSYIARAARAGLADRVRFVGAVSDVRPYYAAADAFVLASLYDPQPNAALEAMACGLPVVTTPKCGAAELLAEGESGYVRDALDVAGMAEALDALREGNPARMGEQARAAVEPYTPAAMAGEYLALYERLLRR
jgi:UDP-glucose:(heptosyl)LPS alpha-1,3-glucosyltransferase